MHNVKIWHEKGKLRHEISVGPHRLIADEPADQGGEDTGPSPFDYLSISLASCTAITLRMYSQRKGWPLENAEVEVTFTRDKDVTRFERKIHLVGALEEEQKKRLFEVATRCPVHKILTGVVQIETTLAGASRPQ